MKLVDVNEFVDKYEQRETSKDMYSSLWQLPKWLHDDFQGEIN